MRTRRFVVLFLLLGLAVFLCPLVSNAGPSVLVLTPPEPQVDRKSTEVMPAQTPLIVPPVAGGPSATLQQCLQQAYVAFRREEPERARVLELMLTEDWTPKELAEYLGRDLGATQHYVHTSSQQLQDHMQQLCGHIVIRPE